MFTDKIELKDFDRMVPEYKDLLGRVLTIQADCEIGGPHLYVEKMLPAAPTKLDQLIVARTAAEEIDERGTEPGIHGYCRYCPIVAGVTLSVFTCPVPPTGFASLPLMAKANAPASPISRTASRSTGWASRSPGCITRANTRRPSTVSDTQHADRG